MTWWGDVAQLGSGQTLDAFALGLEIMTAVILTVNAKIFLVTKYARPSHTTRHDTTHAAHMRIDC
jgi:hypothetical protein